MTTGRAYNAWRRALLIVLAVGVAVSCSQIERLTAVPNAQTTEATVLGIANARYFVDGDAQTALSAEFLRAYEREVLYARKNGRAGKLPPAIYLAVSGGGDNGAF